jgi:hypothetical protein
MEANAQGHMMSSIYVFASIEKEIGYHVVQEQLLVLLFSML